MILGIEITLLIIAVTKGWGWRPVLPIVLSLIAGFATGCIAGHFYNKGYLDALIIGINISCIYDTLAIIWICKMVYTEPKTWASITGIKD